MLKPAVSGNEPGVDGLELPWWLTLLVQLSTGLPLHYIVTKLGQ
jgi:hypothetical protein